MLYRPGELGVAQAYVTGEIDVEGDTGKPLLERDMASRRPGYREYVERTSGFVPLPPRKG